MVPDFQNGWIYQAEALRRMPGQGVQGVWAALLPAADKFPNEPTILYNLACSCQIGKNSHTLLNFFNTSLPIITRLMNLSKISVCAEVVLCGIDSARFDRRLKAL
jgi:hypothetical protein